MWNIDPSVIYTQEAKKADRSTLWFKIWQILKNLRSYKVLVEEQRLKSYLKKKLGLSVPLLPPVLSL